MQERVEPIKEEIELKESEQSPKEQDANIEPKEKAQNADEPKEQNKILEQKEESAPKKSDHLIAKVDKIKQDAESIYNEYNEYVRKFENSSADLAKQENEIIQNTVSKTLELFKKLGVENLASINDKLSEVKLDNKEELLQVKYPSQGRFKGFFYGLLASAATLSGLAAYGAKLSNLPLTLSTFMQKSNLDTIASKYLALLNIDKAPLYGYAVVGGVSLLVGFIVYKLTTFMQKIKNEKYVKSLEENTIEYKQRLKGKIEELKKMLEHLDKIKLVNKKYDVILQEQNAKINRMLFIEQPKKLDDLHKNSKLEVEKTLLIVDELIKLMDTPVSKDDKINEESIANLASANSVINEVIKKLY